MNSTALNNIEAVDHIKKRLRSGEITYDKAKTEAEPIIEAIYEQHKVIAKKYNKRAVKLSFSSLMR